MKKEYSNISPEEAGAILGVRPQQIRIHLQRGKGLFAELGTAEKVNTRYRYYIFKDRVENFRKKHCE